VLAAKAAVVAGITFAVAVTASGLVRRHRGSAIFFKRQAISAIIISSTPRRGCGLINRQSCALIPWAAESSP